MRWSNHYSSSTRGIFVLHRFWISEFFKRISLSPSSAYSSSCSDAWISLKDWKKIVDWKESFSLFLSRQNRHFSSKKSRHSFLPILSQNSNLKQLSILWVTERKKNNAIFSPLDGCLSLTRRRLKQKSLHQNNLPYVFGFFKFVVRRRFLANWGRPWKKLQGLLWSWEELCSEPIAEFCCLMSV